MRLLALIRDGGTSTITPGPGIEGLLQHLRRGDLLVVNDAATLPASLTGRGPRGEECEIRLAGQIEEGRWWAVLMGAGDWRTRTEDRPPPPTVEAGAALRFGSLGARVRRVSPLSPRLVELAFAAQGDRFWAELFAQGRPVQYSHLDAPLEPWDVQTAYASRPWAVEPPSAGLALSTGLLLELRRQGVQLAALTHAAGLSATGDAALDRALPLPERFEVPQATLAAVRRTRESGGRVVAVGTSVVRALETAAGVWAPSRTALLRPQTCGAIAGITDLQLGPGSELLAVDGLLTGLHEPGTSHDRLLRAFVPEAPLRDAYALAEREGLLGHEFGDLMLVVNPPARYSFGRSFQ